MSGRLTIRCLFEDLVENIEDPAQKSALTNSEGLGEFAGISLSDIAHPLVEHLEMFEVSDLAELHDLRIKSVTDVVWYKVKTGRFRGAAFIDEFGTAWLCFAGTRHDGNRDDFYEEFVKRCVGGSRHLLPDDDDRLRFRLEKAHIAELSRLKLLRMRVIEALARSVRDGSVQTVALPTHLDPVSFQPLDGANVVVKVVQDAKSEIDEITLSISVSSHEFARYDDVLHEVQVSVPGLQFEEWDVVPAFAPHIDPCWWVILDSAWIDQFVPEIESRGSKAFVNDPPESLSENGGVKHLVAKHLLTDAMIAGRWMRGLCGHRFVPQHDPDDFDLCHECAVLANALDNEIPQVS